MFTNNGFNPRPEVSISYNREWQEFVVREGNATYHTTDAMDAYNTAVHIAGRTGRVVAIRTSAKSRISKARYADV
jgi:hypothetical protein